MNLINGTNRFINIFFIFAFLKLNLFDLPLLTIYFELNFSLFSYFKVIL